MHVGLRLGEIRLLLNDMMVLQEIRYERKNLCTQKKKKLVLCDEGVLFAKLVTRSGESPIIVIAVV